MEADIVILGAGIAGLRCGIELAKQTKSTIVVLEKYNYDGGRVVTYKKSLQDVKGECTEVQWEIGAARIHTNHTKVHDLIKQYKLTTVSIPSEQLYNDKGVLVPNLFETLLEMFIPALQQFEPSILATHTLRQLFQMLLKEKAEEFLRMFPYRAEVDTLRADLAIETFQKEMGTYQGYVCVKEGLSAMIDGMVKEFKKLGGQIFHKQTVTDIQRDGEKYLIRTKTPNGDGLWESKKVICALHAHALKLLPCFASWKLLSHLKMEPLFRIYAVFPSEKGKSWFSDIGRTVTPGPIRYFIPMNPACGVVMLSYTDSRDARFLENIVKKDGEDYLEEFLMKELRKMFPTQTIPDTLFFKPHPWTEGCTYWLPGTYSPEELSHQALQPFPETMPGVYCCGESFSMRQAWMQGALEHADLLLKTYFSFGTPQERY